MRLLSQIKAQICYTLAVFGTDASFQSPFYTALRIEFNFHYSLRRWFSILFPEFSTFYVSYL